MSIRMLTTFAPSRRATRASRCCRSTRPRCACSSRPSAPRCYAPPRGLCALRTSTSRTLTRYSRHTWRPSSRSMGWAPSPSYGAPPSPSTIEHQAQAGQIQRAWSSAALRACATIQVCTEASVARLRARLHVQWARADSIMRTVMCIERSPSKGVCTATGRDLQDAQHSPAIVLAAHACSRHSTGEPPTCGAHRSPQKGAGPKCRPHVSRAWQHGSKLPTTAPRLQEWRARAVAWLARPSHSALLRHRLVLPARGALVQRGQQSGR